MTEQNDRLSEIDAAVAQLPGWVREGEQLVRRVPVADDARENLEAGVMKIANEIDHHPVIERSRGELCFRVWTHSVGRITKRDFELAARIDQILSGTRQD